MFASSQTDKGKTQQMQEAVREAMQNDTAMSKIASILGGTTDDVGQGNAQFRGPGGAEKTAGDTSKFADLGKAMDMLTRQLRDEVGEGKMQLSMQQRGLVISFQQSTFFPSGDDQISDDHLNIIIKVAEVIRELPNPVRFEGHTDSLPIRANGRFASNWDLSAARAIAMMEALASCCDLDARRFSIAGYADNAPIADNNDDIGRQRNRRVDIVILNGAGASQEPVKQ